MVSRFAGAVVRKLLFVIIYAYFVYGHLIINVIVAIYFLWMVTHTTRTDLVKACEDAIEDGRAEAQCKGLLRVTIGIFFGAIFLVLLIELCAFASIPLCFAVILTICLPPDGAIIVTRYVNQLRSEKSSLRESRMLTRPGVFRLLQIRKTSDGAYNKPSDESSKTPYDEEFNPYDYHPIDPHTPAGGVTEDRKRDSPALEGGMGVESGTEPLVAKDPTVNQRHDV